MAMIDTHSQDIRIVVVDNDPIACQGLELMLTTPSMKVIKTCQDVDDGVAAIVSHAPEVAVVDLHWLSDDRAGLKILKQVHESGVKTACLLLTFIRVLPGIVIREAFDFGAKGFSTKRYMVGPKLPEIVREIASGNTFIEPEMITNLLTDIGVETVTYNDMVQTLPKLAPREREVLALLNHGLTVKEVARGLGITANTVKTYLQAARNKFDGKMNSYQLALFAGLQGWLPDDTPKGGD
jgi:DNA-binding NarL/FixJ family response regulator